MGLWLCISLLTSWAAERLCKWIEEVILVPGPQLSWRDIPGVIKQRPEFVQTPSAERPSGLQDPQSLSAKISSRVWGAMLSTLPHLLPPSLLFLCLFLFLLLINVSSPRWCRQAAARLRAQRAWPSGLTCPRRCWISGMPKGAGSPGSPCHCGPRMPRPHLWGEHGWSRS